MTSPTSIALFSYLSQCWVLNTSSGSQAVIDRVQNIEPSVALSTQKYYELGRKGPVGSTQNPAQYRVSLMQNLVDTMEFDYTLAGKNIAPAGVQTWNLGDIVTNAGKYTLYVLNRDTAGAILDEKEVNSCSISDITWNFTINGAITTTFNFIGTGGKLYKLANTVHTWGATDNVSLGGIHGKEARIWFTSGSVATTRAFRLQTMTLRAAFPTVYVGEMGNRQLVGTLSDAPDVTLDFELLVADDQPTEKFFVDQTTYYDYGNTVTPFQTTVLIDNPTNAVEGSQIVRSFKMDNTQVVAHAPIRSQVRGLSTARYSLISSKEVVADSGGLVISNGA